MQLRKPVRLQGRLDSQEVCLALASSLACLTIERDAFRWPACSRQLAREISAKIDAKIDTKIDPKSVPGAARSCPGAPKIDSKSIPGPSRDGPWCPRAFGKHLGSVLEASRSVPGAPRDRPEGPQRHLGTAKRARGSAREHAEATKIDAKSRPGAQKSSFFCAARSRSVIVAIFRRFLLIFGFFGKSANPLKYRACQQNQGFGRSRCESRRSRDVVSKNIENRLQNRPEIFENRVSSPPVRPSRSTFAARSASVERFSRLLSLEAPRSSDSGRPGPVGRVARAPRSRAPLRTPPSPFSQFRIGIYIYIYIYIYRDR